MGLSEQKLNRPPAAPETLEKGGAPVSSGSENQAALNAAVFVYEAATAAELTELPSELTGAGTHSPVEPTMEKGAEEFSKTATSP